tara:strand:- start:1008 stop:1160 length:153 start_codon:yes stop_codon:yes gene_type:complete
MIKKLYLTQDEISQALYICEQMAIDYDDESTEDYKDYSSLLNKLQTASND